MSKWLHVAGVLRVDDLRILQEDINFEEVIGKTLTFDDIWEGTPMYSEFKADPSKFLPLGSEGSLQMSVWKNPDMHTTAAYTVSIFGDLRDCTDCNAIITWFQDIVTSKNLLIRQAVITVENETDPAVTWTAFVEKD